ncbi:MAG: FAD-dependent monooxygenase, partial [Chthoniobacterales bacterium]
TESLNFILADAVIDGDVPNNKITISWNDNGAVAIFPVVPGIWRVFAQRHNEDTSDPTLEEIQKCVDELCPIGLKLHDPTWLSFFRINERVASKFYDGRIFLLGDAAHIHSPAGGQGMNTGMQDATNLAWKLALVTKGKGDAATLSESYQAERHPIAEAVVKGATDKLHIGMTKGPLMRVVKDLAVSVLLHVPAFRKILSHQLAELDFCYDHSPLTDRTAPWLHAHGGFASGTRPRDVTLKDSVGKSVSLWKRFLQPRHTLLIFSGEKPDAACVQTEELIMLCAEASDEITPVVVWYGDEVPSGKHSCEYLLDPSAEAHRRYGAKGLSWYLIRPDQYTAIRCQPSETAPLERYIAKYFKV